MSDIEQYSVSVNQPEKMIELYQKNGFVLIRNAISKKPLDALITSIETLLEAKLRQLGVVVFGDTLDAKIDQLAGIDEDNVGFFLRACRETLAFYELVLSEELQKLIFNVTNLKMPQVISETCMLRIDRNQESSRDFSWHYDAAYTAQPPQAVTCWIPLTPVDSQMGPLRLIPGSHTTPYPVRFHQDMMDKKLSGPKRVELTDVNINDLESKAIDICPVNPGDVILLHGWTLHRSGKNKSSRARWVVNPRYSDLLDETVLANDWKVSRAGEPRVFEEYYPELVKD